MFLLSDKQEYKEGTSPKLPKEYKYLEKYQHKGLGYVTCTYVHDAVTEHRDCVVCGKPMISGKWDFLGKNTRVFGCHDCELVYHHDLEKDIFGIDGGDKIIVIK